MYIIHARIMRQKKMMYQDKNRMLPNSEQDEAGYGVKHKTRYEREMQAYEEAEREEKKDGRYSGNY